MSYNTSLYVRKTPIGAYSRFTQESVGKSDMSLEESHISLQDNPIGFHKRVVYDSTGRLIGEPYRIGQASPIGIVQDSPSQIIGF